MVQLKSVEEKDKLLIETIYRTTREDELNLTNWPEFQKKAFISMQSTAQLAEYKKNYPGAAYQIIIWKRKPAGRFFVWENDNEIRLIDIIVLPSFRNKGIGTYLLHELIKRSAAVQKKISLHVEPGNSALKLYRRLGFVHIKTNGRHYYMERKPVE